MSMERLQKRIKTTQDLRGIVNTMKMLSSVSITQYEQANSSLRYYRENLQTAFLALQKTKGIPLVTSKNTTPHYLLLIFGSDSGMVGRFNKEILDDIKTWMESKKISKDEVSLISVGKKITQLAEQENFDIFAKYASANSAKAAGSLAETLIIKLEQAINVAHKNTVYVWYHKRGKSRIEVKSRKILPFNAESLLRLRDKKWPTNNLVQITLSAEQLFFALVNQALSINLASILNYSLAAEHYVRMTNMQNAEKNIDESLEEMNLLYQQLRQEEITGELIDVVAGYQAT